MWDFHVGQKVVCVDAKSHGKYTPWKCTVNDNSLHGLEEKRVYTIRKIQEHRGLLVIYLEEIHRPPSKYGECGYAFERFRPLVKRKTDISIFTNMLLPKTNVLDKKEVFEDA